MQTTPGTTPVPSLSPHLWKSTLVSGILSLILGIVVLASPFQSIITLAIVVGIWFVVIGAFKIVSSFGIHGASKKVGKAISPASEGSGR